MKILGYEIKIEIKKIETHETRKIESWNMAIDQTQREADYKAIVETDIYKEIKAKALAARAQRMAQ